MPSYEQQNIRTSMVNYDNSKTEFDKLNEDN